MSYIVHVDPSVGSTNLGDEIISEAVRSQLVVLFPAKRIINMASRDSGVWAKRVMAEADYVFLGGTNALSSDPLFGYRQFDMGRLPTFSFKNVILMGVGWWQYQSKFGLLASAFYKRTLHPSITHSVRDQYTADRLSQLGIESVLNTACPTMWNLESYDAEVGTDVVITLTDYHRNIERDAEFLKNIMAKFSKVYFWPQGTVDVEYLNSFSNQFNLSQIELIRPNLKDFDSLLNGGVTYIGTRLHAGIRALQKQCPSYILPVDNRAVEIAKTESLPLTDSLLSNIVVKEKFRYQAIHRNEVSSFLSQFK